MAYGMQVGSYRQLKDAVAFLAANGVTIKYLPPELFPGIDYSAFALDPEGHAIQLYYYMEQIGWDGRPRPASPRRRVDNAHWPDLVDAHSDTYRGPVFQGPLGLTAQWISSIRAKMAARSAALKPGAAHASSTTFSRRASIIAASGSAAATARGIATAPCRSA